MEELRRIAESDVRFLRGRGVKAMLVACGTVSSNCLDYVQEKAGVPALGVVKPTGAGGRGGDGKRAHRRPLHGGDAAERGLCAGSSRRWSPGLEVFASGSPKLVPLVEAGRADRRIRRSLRRFPNALRG